MFNFDVLCSHAARALGGWGSGFDSGSLGRCCCISLERFVRVYILHGDSLQSRPTESDVGNSIILILRKTNCVVYIVVYLSDGGIDMSILLPENEER